MLIRAGETGGQNNPGQPTYMKNSEVVLVVAIKPLPIITPWCGTEKVRVTFGRGCFFGRGFTCLAAFGALLRAGAQLLWRGWKSEDPVRPPAVLDPVKESREAGQPGIEAAEGLELADDQREIRENVVEGAAPTVPLMASSITFDRAICPVI
jgi:hypothetical protein